MLDALTVFLALTLVGFGLLVLQRRDFSASTLWTFAWVEVFVMASLLQVGPEKPWVEFTAFVLGTLFPALILAGTLSYAQRRVPPWLLPGAFLLGALRGGLAASGSFTLGHTLALPLEPAAMLVAAWIAFGATRGETVSLAQRLLPVSFVFLAFVDAATAISEIRLGEVTTVLVRIWYATGPLIIGIQILALSSLEQRELRRARDKLGQRIAERTANLRESEERFRRLAAMTLEGVALNEYGRIREVNPALCELLGREHQELIGANLEQLFAVDESPGLAELLQSRSQGCCEAQAVRADGTTFPVDVETREMRDRGRTLQVCSIRDIRERKEAERQRRDFERHMQEVQKLESLGVLAGGIAHDFNNLLTVILGNCRLELDELAPDSPRRARIERIRNSGEYASDLVKQMLTYSGKSSVSLTTLDLSQLVGDMLDLLRASVSEKCRLEPELDAELPVLNGDASQIRQVILNLVTNASEALEERAGEVTVATGTVDADPSYLAGTFGAPDLATGRYLFLEVRDTGAGLDAETKARIFEPFFTTKFSGRGLGLASVLGIVRIHGGAIKLHSQPGEGSSFRVLFPCGSGVALQPEPPAPEPPPETTQIGGQLILVIDDDEPVVEVTEAFLTRSGYRVLTATGGRTGLALFHAHEAEIDVVILDAVMPDADGAEVYGEISRRRPDLPVIVATGYSPEMLRQRFDVLGTAGFLQKPYEVPELLQAVRNSLQ